ncbi:MAG: 50S ribosomal protein L30 [Succinivibrio sp.]|nr:50S ribosomal protein L30 [Succinivibrio sp.]MBQ9791432.1 50S ribosomal protein L30 [Clostridia bacterium]
MAEKKTTTKATVASAKKIRVTLVKSPIGYKYDQRKTVEALGLNKLNSSHELVDNAAVRGMIFKVKHLVRVEEI